MGIISGVTSAPAESIISNSNSALYMEGAPASSSSSQPSSNSSGISALAPNSILSPNTLIIPISSVPLELRASIISEIPPHSISIHKDAYVKIIIKLPTTTVEHLSSVLSERRISSLIVKESMSIDANLAGDILNRYGVNGQNKKLTQFASQLLGEHYHGVGPRLKPSTVGIFEQQVSASDLFHTI